MAGTTPTRPISALPSDSAPPLDPDPDPDVERLLTESVRLRGDNTAMSFFGSVTVLTVLAVATLVGLSKIIPLWWAGMSGIIYLRVHASKLSKRAIQDGNWQAIVEVDKRFRLLSVINQIYLGAGIWLTFLTNETHVDEVVTLLIIFASLVTVINIRSDIRSYYFSVPLLYAQPIILSLIHISEPTRPY